LNVLASIEKYYNVEPMHNISVYVYAQCMLKVEYIYSEPDMRWT